MTRFETIRNRSEVVFKAISNVHPIQVTTNRVEGYLEAELTEGGLFDLSKPVSGWLEIAVDDLKSGNPLLDRIMPGQLDTRRFPTIKAEIIEVFGENGSGYYEAEGNITFHGVTRRMEDAFTIEWLDSNTLAIRGEIVVDVRLFDITPPQMLMLKVEPEITVKLNSIVQQID